MAVMYGKSALMQSAKRLIFPPRCVSCGGLTDTDHGLCAACWRETAFILGAACDKCGAPLPGEAADAGDICDDCLVIERPWARGRAALSYTGTARRLVLQLKHGDRTDLAIPAAHWMARAGAAILSPDSLLVPVPMHWTRFVRRRYNQSALLAQELARLTGIGMVPDALVRNRRTRSLEGQGRDERFRTLDTSIGPHPRRGAALAGREVVLVDDVMTSGATLAACAAATLGAGATRICVLVLARAAKDH